MTTKDEAISTERALKLALEALENSLDLVSHEAREAEKMYANVPTRLARVQGFIALEVAHEKAITTLREALNAPLAEQPAQRTWVGLTDEEVLIMSRYDLEYAALIGEVQRKLKEKNSDF